jgi:hypothetical protein
MIPAAVLAQSSGGTIRGAITDSSGSVIQNTAVTMRRNTPSLGRPEQLPGQNKSGSAVPLQNADISGQDNNNDEVPDDLNNMARRRSRPEPPKALASDDMLSLRCAALLRRSGRKGDLVDPLSVVESTLKVFGVDKVSCHMQGEMEKFRWAYKRMSRL